MSGAAAATTGLEIAIIGKAGRFPGASDLASFWRNLRDGVESISFFSTAELLAAGADPALLADPSYVPAYGEMEGADLFDADFFGYSPREAEIMDPQQRVFLECAWEALEDAGYEPRRCPGPVGVYGGMAKSTYLLQLLRDPKVAASLNGQYAALGGGHDFLCTRISYKLGLEGPSLTVQTACSTSLVAVHLACQALLSGECQMALAGGVAVRFPQQAGHLHQEGGILSADGHCRAFDARATGTVGGSGVGIVVLKRLESALEDGDSICAVIKGSAINNDGSAKAGYTAPRMDGQARVIRAAQVLAEVPAETIGYVETHGTATRLGDPIELAALTRAFRSATGRKGFCALGSVKSNIGHLDTAAGVAGLLKAVLALEERALPPSLHFETPNPEFDLAGSPFYVNTRLSPWPAGPAPLRAGVSSFGIGGTNAHIVLEEAPPRPAAEPGRPWQLLVLSARTEPALADAAARLREHLRTHPDLELADVAYTCQVGRRELDLRQALVCRSLDEAVERLGAGDPRWLLRGSPGPADPSVAFMFSGLGDHYVGMGRGLYRGEPAFREQVDRSARLVEPLLGCDLRDVLYPVGDRLPDEDVEEGSAPAFDLRRMVRPRIDETDEAARRLDRTAFAQPAMFVLEHALAQLWISWGIRPQAMIGYSLGEYVAACLAGVLSLEDALTLVTRRAQMIDALPEGGMLAASLPESRLRSHLGEDLSLAAVHGSSLCVVGGPLASLADLERRLVEAEVPCRRLAVSHAFHTSMLESMAGPLRELFRSFDLHPPRIPYISNLTGTWIEASQATDPEYWVEHSCRTVRFGEGVEEVWKEPGRILLEIGPGQSLGQFALQQLEREREGIVLPSLRSANERRPDQAFLLRTLGRLWLAGVPVDWAAFHAPAQRRRVPLPTYPFQRRRYRVETDLPRPLHPDAGPAAGEPARRAPAAERPGRGAHAATPGSEVERALVGLWRDLLGVERVSLDDNFFHLGGDSLRAIDLGARIKSALGVELAPGFLLEAPTVRGLASLVATALGHGDGPRSTPSPSSCLVEMQSGNGGGRLPFYLIHPVGGHVYFYREVVAALGEDQPVYGLRASGFEEGEEIHGSIEQMAAHYVEAVRSRQDRGPYLLGGSSMGGMVAFEMAQQLRMRGLDVAVLAMIDTPGPSQMPVRPADQAEFLFELYGSVLPISVDELRRRGEQEQVDYLLATARAAEALPAGFSLDNARRQLKVIETLWQAMFDYRPRAYPGRVLFFRAKDRGTIGFSNPEQAWIDLAEAGTEVHVVPGDHVSMHREPHLDVLAGRLRAALDRVPA